MSTKWVLLAILATLGVWYLYKHGYLAGLGVGDKLVTPPVGVTPVGGM